MELNPNNNIEELFRHSFDEFQPDVDPKVWTNIQRSISKSGNGTTSWFGSLAGKLILGTAAVTLVTVSAILLSGNNQDNSIKKNDLPKNTTAQNNTVTTNNTSPVNNDQPVNNNTTNTNNTDKKQVAPVTNTHNTAPDKDVKTTVTPVKNEPVNPENPISNNNPPVNNNNDHKTDVTNPPNNPVKTPVNENPVNNNNPDPINTTTVSKLPVAVIDFSPTGNTYAPVNISFQNKGKAVSQEWSFGDGTFTSYEKAPMHIFEYPGEYIVILIATNEAGKTEKDSIRIKIASNGFFIPNTFTPNGDGNNDSYKIIKNDSYPYEVTNLEIVVFDRTNQKVASFNSTDYAWDGRSIMNGQMCPQGTYLVVVKYTSSEDGKSHEQRGALFLKE